MDTKYNHQEHDARVQQKWAKEKTYTFIPNNGKQVFSIDTPPPTVSGTLHIGHVFSYTQTDIIARYKRLCGFNVFYPFGFDDNGLATERFVEKKNKVTGYSMKRDEFIELCLEESEQAEQTFKKLWQSLGLSADWTKTYSTISPSVRKISQASFVALYEKNKIYRKQEPALYCTTCFTTVAQAELDDIESHSTFNDIDFTINETGKTVTISTTRPELLSSCVALFYHPEDARYTHLKGKHAVVPVFGNLVPCLPEETVLQEKGTGLVMCCTFGDKNDILWFKKHNLPYRPSVGVDGKWHDNTKMLAGLRAHAARITMLEVLKEQGFLVKQTPLIHAINVHERCKKEIEYLIINQWFLKILDQKEAMLTQIDAIDWYPAFMKSRCRDWIENLQWDWCLSRKRFYGIPFPVWHCLSCEHVIVAPLASLPIDPQEDDCPVDACPACGSKELKGDTDVMDTWNTSSVTPYICAQLQNPTCTNPIQDAKNMQLIPMSMRPQAHDIIRTWAFYTILKRSE